MAEERSASTDGHRKIGLPTDHFTINKYAGPDGYSYIAISLTLKEMAEGAAELIPSRTRRGCVYATEPHTMLNFHD